MQEPENEEEICGILFCGYDMLAVHEYTEALVTPRPT